MKHVIITGGNSGIGKATAMDLAKQGMSITLACRNSESGAKAASELTSITGSTNIRSMQCDLASFSSMHNFVKEYKQNNFPLHVLVNNAGIMACPLSYTQEGFEQQFGVNHLGHFLLTMLLMDLLHSSATELRRASRVVVLASAAEQIGNLDFEDLNYTKNRAYNPWFAYGQSKLANCLFSLEMSRQCSKLKLPVTCNSMHPGIVDTQLIRHILPGVVGSPDNSSRRLFRNLTGLKSPEEGAQTVTYLATSHEVENITGEYFQDCRITKPSLRARDRHLAEKLWKVSEELTGVEFLNNIK